MKKLLLVEDDQSLGFVIKDNLEQEGFGVDLATTGNDGLEMVKSNHYDLLVLDVMLPGIDGFSIAESIRESQSEIPILFLSAKSMLEDRLEGLRRGGDDYLTKPFSMEELVLKINVFLKRSSRSSEPDTYQLGNYMFDPMTMTLALDGSTYKLTQKESQLLRLLCQRMGVVLKREEILQEIWGSDDYFLGRSMDVFISKLRKHLKQDSRISIANYHGVGFRLEVSD